MPLEETKIVVTKEEWEDAEKFFQENPDEVKFRKVQTVRGKKEGHSFVKIAGDIYALNNVSHTAHEADAGVGAFGRVKRAINQKGEMIVIKIESKEMKEMSEDSILTVKNEKLMRKMGYLLDRKERYVGDTGKVKAKSRIRATTKVLTAFQYRGNKELAAETFSNEGEQAPKNLIYGLKAMMGIASLHRGGILHRDIKAENFVLNGQGAGLTVMPIDFDFSHKLSKGKKGFKDHVSLGTPGFMAPEIDKKFNYSFASDVYALGNMFKTQLFLPKEIYAPMMHADPKKRMTLQAAMQSVVAELNKPEYNNKPEVVAVLKEHKKQKEEAKGMNIGKSIRMLYEKIKKLPKKTIKTTPASEPLIASPAPAPVPKKETTKGIQPSLKNFNKTAPAPSNINVADSEWDEAEAFFNDKNNLTEVKFQKKNTTKGAELGHSFVKIAGTIYALNNTKHVIHEPDAGVGGFARAKRGVSRKGKKIVVKIEAEELREKNEAVDKIMKESGYMLGREEREVKKGESGTVKAGIKRETKTKVLTAFEYRGDRNLFQETSGKNDNNNIPPQNLIYGLKAMMGIASLHRGGIIHRDIKRANFVLNGQGESLIIMPVDFDISHKLSSNQPSVIEKDKNDKAIVMGTQGFIAPEIEEFGMYSYATDVYALGAMLKSMRLPPAIYESMMKFNPNARMPLQAAMQAVVTELSKTEYKDNPEVKAVLKEHTMISPTDMGAQSTFVYLPPPPPPLLFSPSMQKKETTKDIQESLQVFLEKIFEKALPEQLASLKGVLEMARNSLKSVNANPRDIIMYLDLKIKELKDKQLIPGKNVELDNLQTKLTEFKGRLDNLAPPLPNKDGRPLLVTPTKPNKPG